MQLAGIDWGIMIAFFAISLAIGLIAARKVGRTFQSFFLVGRRMPWWLLGVSMVATTFSTDTPNLVADIVRSDGTFGNWTWWAFLITGMLTVFLYARLWRRSQVFTDIEFYEIRYSGPVAAFLRGFRGAYLGIIFNVLIMASVTLAAIKIGGVMMGWTPVQTVLIAAGITLIYATAAGLRGILLTDLFQFGFAMGGSVAAAWYIVNLPEVGGMGELLAQVGKVEGRKQRVAEGEREQARHIAAGVLEQPDPRAQLGTVGGPARQVREVARSVLGAGKRARLIGPEFAGHHHVVHVGAVAAAVTLAADGCAAKQQVLVVRNVERADGAHDAARRAPHPRLPRVHVVAVHLLERFGPQVALFDS
jgi:hypothetical protein